MGTILSYPVVAVGLAGWSLLEFKSGRETVFSNLSKFGYIESKFWLIQIVTDVRLSTGKTTSVKLWDGTTKRLPWIDDGMN